MKHILSAALTVMLILFSAACKKNNESDTATENSIFCTTYPVWLTVRALTAGTNQTPELLVSADAGCPHDFALTAAELRKFSVKRKLILFRNGGGLDDHLVQSLRSVNGNFTDISAADGELPHAHDELCRHRDPHIFTAPGTLKKMVQKFAGALADFDPENSTVYMKNRDRLTAELDELSGHAAGTGQGRSVILMHNTFRNLAEEAGFQVAETVFDGHISSLAPADMAKLIALIRNKKIDLLITEPQVPEQIAKQIQAETGIRVLSLDPAASGSHNAPPEYLTDTLRRNIEQLKKTSAQ